MYQRNPLAEVICQLRFADLGEITADKLQQFTSLMNDQGYTSYIPDTSVVLKQELMAKVMQGDFGTQPFEHKTTYRFQNQELGYSVSLERGFLALSCIAYTEWDDFAVRLKAAVKQFTQLFGSVALSRLGLRYRNVIEREELGLSGVPWHELISGFLLGPLVPNALMDGQMVDESRVGTFLSQTMMYLENSPVLLQSALLTSAVDKQVRALMIDADFFLEEEIDSQLLERDDAFDQQINALHADSGNLFRRGITERLLNALRTA
ncbi:TIGR04255 family protein [Herbaspirillum robiniae]|uniref:TIGR04255 family protein n=1 Tax=Herbaspirillum robiniae TaxID=2014887 RepID=UPI001EDAD155|nr:TIGR04255 family protein [Herbaspirillum robiniae]